MMRPSSVNLGRLESSLGKGFKGMWILRLWSHQMSLEISSKGERELPLGGFARKTRKRIWDNFPSVIMGQKGFKILPNNSAKMLSHNL
jgi:hypothetical protein